MKMSCNHIILYHIHIPTQPWDHTATVQDERCSRWRAGHFLLLACQEMSLCYQHQLDLCCCHTSWFIVAWLPTLECITLVPRCWKHQDQTGTWRYGSRYISLFPEASTAYAPGEIRRWWLLLQPQRTYNLHLCQVNARRKESHVRHTVGCVSVKTALSSCRYEMNTVAVRLHVRAI